MKLYIYITVLVLMLCSCLEVEKQFHSLASSAESEDWNVKEQKDYEAYHQEAKHFVVDNQMNKEFYFLLDLSIHSGKNRFFVYSFQEQKIIEKGLVTHGACDVIEPNPDKLKEAVFSNVKESHCSSLGKFRIGKRDYSNWGVNYKYWMHGLEKDNNNVEDRVVVLHSWNIVPDEEIYPQYAALSWGCPAVSNSFMENLDRHIKATNNKDILMWIIK